MLNQNIVNPATVWKLKPVHLIVTTAMAILASPAAYAEHHETLPEVAVKSKKDTRTTPLDLPASTASRLGITLQEIPASVEVLTQETMQERGNRTVTEAVEKAAGFTAAVTPGSPGMISTRGFTSNAVAWLYNGVRIPGGSSMSARVIDIANFDRIEIIKGPAGVLHGEGSIGGAINLISRAPTFSSKQPWELDYAFSSFDTHRLHLGTGGVMNDDVAAYHVDYSGSRFGTVVDHERGSLDRFTGSVLFKLTDKTKLTLELDKLYDDTDNVYFGTPLVNGKLKRSLRKVNYNDISGNRYESDTLWLRANLEWIPNETWEVRNQTYYYDSYRDWRNVEAYAYNANNTVTRSSWGDLDHDHQLFGNRFEVLHKGQIAGLDNRFMIGTDVNRTDFQNKRNGFPGSQVVTNPYEPQDTSFAIGSGGVYKGTDIRDVTIDQWSVFMDDQLSLNQKLKAVVGLRYDQFDTNWKYTTPASVAKEANKFEFVSFRVGGVYDITPTFTTYVSFGSAVEPGSTLLLLNRNQSQLDLTTARQGEIGLKHGFWEGKGEWTAAIYEITKNNVFVPDPASVNGTNRIPVGQQSSRGMELSVGLRPTDQWQIDANIAATRARYDDYSTVAGGVITDRSGNQPPFVPDYVANLGLRYMPTSALSFSTWIRHVDGIYADDANTVKLPSYTTVDLAADYKFNKIANLGFRVRNLTDELYATFGSTNGRQAMIAAPRTFEISVNLRY